MRRWVNLLLALSASAAFVPAASADHVTPTALYQALLATPISAASLPSGFSPPVGAQKAAVPPQEKRHHAVGIVRIFLTGGLDGGVAYGAGAYYDVFPNHQDAVADYRAGPSGGQAGTPRSFPTPARIVNSSLPNGGTKFIAVEYVDGNVSVFAYLEAVGENPLPRHALPRVLTLGRFTLNHLERVRGTP
jgi:hypothetical protein